MDSLINRFANFYRIQYVILAILGLIIIFGGLWWSDRQQTENLRKKLLNDCVLSCTFEKSEFGIIKLDEIKPADATREQCINSCHKEYDKLK